MHNGIQKSLHSRSKKERINDARKANLNEEFQDFNSNASDLILLVGFGIESTALLAVQEVVPADQLYQYMFLMPAGDRETYLFSAQSIR
jgi:hypothetical protein